MKHSRTSDRNAISYHYDVGNDFYGLFLGNTMTYSCAYFRNGNEDLDRAQTNKLDHICRKLRLKEGEKLLDIGCGWGGLIIHAAKNYGVKALGITLSREQHKFANERIKNEGLSGLARAEIMDYRDLKGNGVFDKISSVGMFEHVGIKNLPLYFGTAKRLLNDKGLFLNHGITSQKYEKKGNSGIRFINDFVFPDGELTDISHIQHIMESSGFEVLDVESMRQHYAKTLRHWTANLMSRKAEALKIAGERIYRIWVLYMAGCSYGFEKGNIGIYQVLLSKNRHGYDHIPPTREDIYHQRNFSRGFADMLSSLYQK
jgi:cyclopropane-fatty-acyl-phospholipid synthase